MRHLRHAQSAWVRASLVAAAATIFALTRLYADIAPARAKLVETTQVAHDGVLRATLNEAPDQPRLTPPLALIFRASSPSNQSQQLVVTVDGTPACTAVISDERSRRIDCVIHSWQPALDHDVTITSDAAAGWSLQYLEVATHHGNSTGFNRLYILPEGGRYVAPAATSIVITVLLIGGLALVSRQSFSSRRDRVFDGLAAVVVALLVVIQILPWLSSYLVVLSTGTFVRWALIASLPRVITAGRWLASTTRADQRGPHALKALAVGAAAMLLFSAIAMRELRENYHGNFSGFVKIARSYFDSNPLVNAIPGLRESLILMDDGYDGERMYVAAFDPFLRAFKDRPAVYGEVMGATPGYRYGRIGFSVLTRLVAVNRWRWYPAAMMGLVLGSLWACGSLLAWLAQQSGRSAIWGGVVLLVPGFWVSMQNALPEPLAAALMLAGFVLLFSDRPVVAAPFFAASLLVRETGVVAVGGAVLWMLWHKRHRQALWFGALAIVPLLAWRGYVGWILWPVWGVNGIVYSPPSGGPLMGIVTMWRLIARGEYWPHVPQMAKGGIGFPLLLMLALGISSLRFVRGAYAVGLSGLLYGINAISLDYPAVWAHVWNAERTTYELFVLVAIGTIATRHWSRVERTAVVVFWCSATVYIAWFTLDAAYIRNTLWEQLFVS